MYKQLLKNALQIIFIVIFCTKFSTAQVVTISPAFATADDNNVVITFDASLGNAGLLGESTIYAHTGVITDKSTSGSDWKYVLTDWSTNLPKALLTRVGSSSVYNLTIGNIRTFYGVPATEKVLKIALVFRNANGSKTGKTVSGGDIFIDISQGSYQVKLNNPIKASFFNAGDSISISCSASRQSNLELYANGVLLRSVTNDSAILYKNTIDSIGTDRIDLVLKGDYNGDIVYDSSYVIIKSGSNVQIPPAGTVDGINYINDSTVTLQIYAPLKTFIYVIGDFNNWELKPQYKMSRTPGAERFWITITGLKKGVEYGFQYAIDEVQMRVADVYAEKILDPNNDVWIPEITYPNLKKYPVGKTTEIISVLQTGQAPFVWQTTNFVKPPKEKLVIYELLLRDFIGRHDFQTLKDTLDYLQRLGVNCIELMPITEFEGNESWGYNPMFHFAIDKYYGTKQAFKEFVDECHKRKMAVVLDMVLNHSFGQNPQVRMYFDPSAGQFGQPTANNPWFNQTDKHPYGVGYDYNHEAQPTIDFVNRVNHFWLTEYHLDGYRFDLSKGFTQKNTFGNEAAWNAYDQSRVNIWKRIRSEIIKHSPDAYLILEHLADNDEEKVLANEGFMMWGKMTSNYAEAVMGYDNSKANLNWGDYKSRQYNSPNLVTYAESHDEERVVATSLQYGRVQGTYSTKDLNTVLKRVDAYHALLLPLIGPKMIWQGGELGYEVSINTNGRTGNKPFNWSSLTNSIRKKAYENISKLNKLKQHVSFSSNNYTYSTSSVIKTLKVNHDSMNTIITGNFDVITINAAFAFQHTGWWYNYITGDSVNITDVNTSFLLQAGEYRVFTDKNIYEQLNTTGIKNVKEDLSEKWNLYPNPSNGKVNIIVDFENYSNLELGIYDIVGKKVYNIQTKNQYIYGAQEFELDITHLPKGLYLVKAKTDTSESIKKLIVN
ncbi:MAG: alpha-amylase family glycosyl hydrolase [Bacteroidota bacterium]